MGDGLTPASSEITCHHSPPRFRKQNPELNFLIARMPLWTRQSP
jgi:hypothetical protein